MTLALYRAYRPGTLAEVVGQDHVTAPLTRALATGRVHHAYLFSGPRGCGKTSTARILARSLNCEQGPTPTPCGTCDNCLALAPNGPGSQDVIELDAASHGGVDDTRELRERVIYSPAHSRYRIYIIDEAHMVTTQGFNALLKVIEEPPEYVRFIFATTEPEKVLGTIRSRTFNYAFRLVSVGVLSNHLAAVCDAERVPYQVPALPLIARAAGGSVRDALSILGQLIAGSADEGLTVEFVSSGLGLTDAVLLDRVISAIAARDGAEAFAAVDAVVESGHDGRRFLTDLLGRLRDLIVLRHVPAADQAALLQLPSDQIDVLRGQGDLFGPAELSRAADLVSGGLSELKGATSPRLQLELLLARLLLPAADDDEAGLRARLDRLERSVAAGVVHVAAPPAAADRRVQAAARPSGDTAVTAPSGSAAGPAAAALAPAGAAAAAGQAAAAAVSAGGTAAVTAPAAGAAAAPQRPPANAPAGGSATATRNTAAGGTGQKMPAAPPRLSDLAPASRTAATPESQQTAPPSGSAASGTALPSHGAAASEQSARGAGASSAPAPARSRPAPAGELDAVRNAWSAVLAELGRRSRVAWALWDSSDPVSVADGALTVSVTDQGRLTSIKASRRDELLRQVLIDLLRVDLKVVPVLAATTTSGDPEVGEASPDDPDLGDSDVSGVDLVIREFGAVPIGEIGEV